MRKGYLFTVSYHMAGIQVSVTILNIYNRTETSGEDARIPRLQPEAPQCASNAGRLESNAFTLNFEKENCRQ